MWLTVALLALAGGLRAEDETWTVEVGTTQPTSASKVDFQLGAARPVEGVRPGMYFLVRTDIHSAFLHVADDGTLVLETANQSGPQYGEEISVDADGNVALVLPNPLDLWCRLYLDSEPAISTDTRCTISIDRGTLKGTPRDSDASDIVDGEYFHLGWVGPQTKITTWFACSGGLGGGKGRITFNTRPDGTTAPALAPVADTRLLWPPNHEMVDVLVEANATDASGGTVTLEVEVLSSEPPEFDGSGSHLLDYEIVSVDSETGEIALHLRAERSGKGDGRIYTIVITATDSSGNVSVAEVQVKAPHDRRSK